MARASSRTSGRSEILRGSETPRIFTPPLRDLTEATTLGFDCATFAEDVLGITLYPWQRWLLIHGLELNEGGKTYRFRQLFVLVGRQNGKSTLLQVLALWRMYVDRAALTVGTAQNLKIAREQWLGAVEIAQGVDDLAREIKPGSPVVQRGSEELSLQTGERYQVVAGSRRGGRGLSVDLLLMDELREHQSWDAWSAISKTTNARSAAQIWAVSNAGDAASVVLRHFRMKAHERLGDPDGLNAELDGVDAPEGVEDDSLGIFEWSAAPKLSVWDRGGWAQSNPSLGCDAVTEAILASNAASDPEWTFRTEVLCQWNSGSVEGPFPAGAWEKCLDPASSIRDATELTVGIDVSADRSYTSIVLAGLNQDGVPHVEVAASRAGTEWVAGWLLERQKSGRLAAVALQGKGAPVSPLAGELEAAGLPVLRWEGAALAAGTGKFFDAVCHGTLRHVPQPPLDIAAATATTRPLGDNWVWNRRQSATDIAPLVAATAAWWALTCRPVKRVSAYEDSGLIVA